MWKVGGGAGAAPRFLAATLHGSARCAGCSLRLAKCPRERAGVIFSCNHKVACWEESGSLPGLLYPGRWYLRGPPLQPQPWAPAWYSFATIISLDHLPRPLLGHKNNAQIRQQTPRRPWGPLNQDHFPFACLLLGLR